MCETYGDEANGTETVDPPEVTAVTDETGETDGDETNCDPETGTVTPDSVTTGEDQAGAGV
jgi:hypothetical protein